MEVVVPKMVVGVEEMVIVKDVKMVESQSVMVVAIESGGGSCGQCSGGRQPMAMADNIDYGGCKDGGQEARWRCCNDNGGGGRGGWWMTVIVDDVKMVDSDGGGGRQW